MTGTPNPADLQKVGARRAFLERRNSISAAELAQAGTALANAVVAMVTQKALVAAYAAFGTEPPTAALLEGLSRAGTRVLLPVLQVDGDLDWAVWEGDLVAGPHGTRHPSGPLLGQNALGACALVVVPALAVDRLGVRLGRGGGAYDRALPRARGTTVAALHDGELVDALPAEPHDVMVHAAVTPSTGLVRLPAKMSR